MKATRPMRDWIDLASISSPSHLHLIDLIHFISINRSIDRQAVPFALPSPPPPRHLH
eukprot:m.102170 g.102170  ORF g.102170 m.102170 type:complete len:57 (-) comp15002_c1_seq1:1118-1288(-)